MEPPAAEPIPWHLGSGFGRLLSSQGAKTSYKCSIRRGALHEGLSLTIITSEYL
jgi:hypothetical protein